MREFCRFAAPVLAAGICFGGFAAAAQAQYLIAGNDEKLFFVDGKPVVQNPPGKDTVSIVDIRDLCLVPIGDIGELDGLCPRQSGDLQAVAKVRHAPDNRRWSAHSRRPLAARL